MGRDYWIKWAKAAGVRAIKTAAEAAIGVIGGSLLFSEVDWRLVGSAAVIGALSSVLLSLKGLPELKVPELSNEEGGADA